MDFFLLDINVLSCNKAQFCSHSPFILLLIPEVLKMPFCRSWSDLDYTFIHIASVGIKSGVMLTFRNEMIVNCS